MLPKVAIIILNWQQPKLTIDTVNSLLKITHPRFDYHIFLVDNGSADNSLWQFQQAFRHHPKISLLQTSRNLMFVAGNNFAIGKIPARIFKYTLLLNNDIIVDPDFLTTLVNYLESHSRFGAVGPKIFFAPGYEFQSNYSKKQIGRVIWSVGGQVDWSNVYASNSFINKVDTGQFESIIIDPDYISGCCLLTQTKLLKKYYLDTNYWMYLEDVDFCQKIKKGGFHLAVIPQAKIWHLNSGSTRAGGGPLHDYFLSRNRLIFGFKYSSLKTKFALIRQSFSQLFSTSTKWQKLGILDFYLHRWGQGSWPNA